MTLVRMLIDFRYSLLRVEAFVKVRMLLTGRDVYLLQLCPFPLGYLRERMRGLRSTTLLTWNLQYE